MGLVPVNLDFVPASASLAPGIHSSWKKKREGRKKEKRKHPVGDGDDGWVEVAGVCPRNRFLASITQWRALFFLTFARCITYRVVDYGMLCMLWLWIYVSRMVLPPCGWNAKHTTSKRKERKKVYPVKFYISNRLEG